MTVLLPLKIKTNVETEVTMTWNGRARWTQRFECALEEETWTPWPLRSAGSLPRAGEAVAPPQMPFLFRAVSLGVGRVPGSNFQGFPSTSLKGF